MPRLREDDPQRLGLVLDLRLGPLEAAMTGHPPLCICPACAQRRETQLRHRVDLLVMALQAVDFYLKVRTDARIPSAETELQQIVATALKGAA